MRNLTIATALLVLLAACGPRGEQQSGEAPSAPIEEPNTGDGAGAELPEVAPEFIAAPNEAFTAIEPSELQIQADETILDALAPLLGPEMTLSGEALSLSIRESGDEAVADIVRENITGGTTAAGHLRIEFQRGPEGWYPINAYRRMLCQSGDVLQWTSGLCP